MTNWNWTTAQQLAYDKAVDAGEISEALSLNEAAAELVRRGNPAFASDPQAAAFMASAGGGAGAASAAVAPVQGTVVPLDLGARQELAPVGAAHAAAASGATAVATVDTQRHLPAAPADHSGGVEGMDVGAEDLEIPTLKLKQEMSEVEDGAEVPNGHWFTSLDPAGSTPERVVAFLANRRGRALWLPKEPAAADALAGKISQRTGVQVPDQLDGPVCWSEDRVTPVKSEWGPLHEDCATCPFAKWYDVRGKRAVDCHENYTFLVADLTDDGSGPLMSPAIYRGMKSAVKPIKRLLTNMQIAGRRHRLPMAGFTVALSSAKKMSPQNTPYYEPVFGRPQPIADEELRADLVAMRDSIWQGGTSGEEA